MSNQKFSPTVPFNIYIDKNIKNLSKVIDEVILDIKQKSELILLLPKLDSLPNNILDELAYQFHVDFYKDTFTHEIKVSLIKNSIAMHRIKGTPYAVEDVCQKVFKSAKVVENWEYGGKPYHFKVKLISESMPNQKVIDDLNTAINMTKNVRSWCDELGFYRKLDNKIYYALLPTQHRVINIYPTKFKQPDIYSKIHIGFLQNNYRRVEIR